ncbi:MAG: mandelate racemase/muconate lactonizing enzyme family protein [Acidimicrobiia bacterium]
MKISSLEARTYRLPLERPFLAAWDPVPRTWFGETIVVVNTDVGAKGFCGGASVPDLDLLSRFLTGVDPEDTEAVFGVCETIDFHGGRNWTVEVAVWDLLARSSQVPLWRLLGGATDRFRAYASTGERLDPSGRAERLVQWKEQGLGAAKIRFHQPDWRQDVKVVEAARDAVGEEMELMVDANQGWRMPGDLAPRWDVSTALDCARALAELRVYWLEEPLETTDIDGYRRLRDEAGVRIAAGEMVRSLPESKQLLDVVDVIQNDAVLAGGVTGCRRVAEWAKAAGKVWSPHTWSTGYGLLANLNVALASSTGEFLEVPFDPPAWPVEVRDFMLPEPTRLENGWLVAPPGPGLGMEPDLYALEKWRVS